jgi:hypothetical protein
VELNALLNLVGELETKRELVFQVGPRLIDEYKLFIVRFML